MGEKSFIPNRNDRERDKKVFKSYTNDLSAKGAEGIRNRFEFLDSTLDNPHENPDDFMSFEDSFASIVPSGESGLRSYIEGILKERQGQAVGIEFGGPGVRLFQSFTPGFFQKSVGVTLVDHYQETGVVPPDYGSHKVIQGDIRSPTTYEKIDSELDGAKADLIMERLLGGWDYIQNDPALFGKILSQWYELLNDNGLLIAEGPPPFPTIHKPGQDFRALLEEWQKILVQQYPTELELRLGTSALYESPVFSLHKHAGAPEKLPLIPIRDLLKP